MLSREEIVGKLLSEKKITAEEAVVLLMVEKQYIYMPYYDPNIPAAPFNPSWIVTCNAVPAAIN